MHNQPHTEAAKVRMSLAKLGRRTSRRAEVIVKSCLYCGKEFKIYGGYFQDIDKKYCTHTCYALSLKGKAPWNKGLNNYVTPTDFRRPEMKSDAYISWRNEVFRLDNYYCRRCFAHSGEGKRVNLVAHHIKPWKDFPELRYDVDNGATLCVKCHSECPNYVPLLNRVNSVKPVTGDAVGNTEPNHLISNRQVGGVETKPEETIMATSALHSVMSDEIVHAF
jgi:hypothetical protein